MTSFPPRFSTLAKILTHLNKQTVYPRLLILNIAYEDIKELPEEIANLNLNFPFEIFPTSNLGPGTKLLPTLKRFPKETIVTIDDDIYYAQNLFEKLISTSKNFPRSIICCRAHEPVFIDFKPATYLSWIFGTKKTANRVILPTGVGGTLFPPGSFHNDVLNLKDYIDFSYSTDDLWYWVHAIRNLIEIRKIDFEFDLIENESEQAQRLHYGNIAVNNDINLQKMWSRYNLSSVMSHYVDTFNLQVLELNQLPEFNKFLYEFTQGRLSTGFFHALEQLGPSDRASVTNDYGKIFREYLDMKIVSRDLNYAIRLSFNNFWRKIKKLKRYSINRLE